MAWVSRIVVVRDALYARVYSPYEHREVIKNFPGRRWEPAGKYWTVPLDVVDAVADALRAAGCTVYVTRSDGSPWGAGARHGVRDQPGRGWADALLDAVGPERIDQTVRAMSRVLHPDAGGDHRLMCELTAARERRNGGAR